MTEEAPSSFSAAATGLRAKRRALGKELLDFLRLTKPDNLPTIEVFQEKRAYFEERWNDVVRANDNCLSLLNTGEEHEAKKAEELRDALEDLRDRKERLNYLEEEIMRKTADSTDLKDAVASESDGALDEKTISTIESDNETDLLAKKETRPANAHASDVEESSLSRSVERNVNLSGEPHVNGNEIIGAIQDMGKSFYIQLSENNAQLNDNMNENMNHLNNNIAQLSKDISVMQGSIGEIRDEVMNLKTENVEIKKNWKRILSILIEK